MDICERACYFNNVVAIFERKKTCACGIVRFLTNGIITQHNHLCQQNLQTVHDGTNATLTAHIGSEVMLIEWRHLYDEVQCYM